MKIMKYMMQVLLLKIMLHLALKMLMLPLI